MLNPHDMIEDYKTTKESVEILLKRFQERNKNKNKTNIVLNSLNIPKL